MQADDPDTAIKISEALIEGGLSVLEVVLRTDEALKCLEVIADKFRMLMLALAQYWGQINRKTS